MKQTTMTTRTAWLLAVLLTPGAAAAAPTATLPPTAVAAAQPAGLLDRPGPEERAEFNKMVRRRNKLHARLERLDRQAADLIKNDQNPLVVHAEQVSVQDELDLVELRLAILSTRHGLPVPPVPGASGPEAEVLLTGDEVNRNVEQAFSRGRQRAVQRLRGDVRQFLGALDFSGFLES